MDVEFDEGSGTEKQLVKGILHSGLVVPRYEGVS